MRYAYFEWKPSQWKNLLDYQQLRRFFHHLVTVTAGDVDEALEIMRRLQEQGYLPADADLDQFRRELEERREIRADDDGGFELTPRANAPSAAARSNRSSVGCASETVAIIVFLTRDAAEKPPARRASGASATR